MENISTAVHGQCWISDEICKSLWSCWLIVQRALKQWQRFGMDYLKSGRIPSGLCKMLTNWQEWCWERNSECGEIHLNCLSDWLQWQFNGRGYNDYKFLCMFRRFHILDSDICGLVSLLFSFVQTKLFNHKNFSVFLLCQSDGNMFFDWPHTAFSL